MTFSWEDEYDERQAQSKMKRLMKQENERQRSSARKEYSQSVRSLVKFVRNKDPRWANIKARQEKETQERDLKLKQEAAQRRKEKDEKIRQEMERLDKINLYEDDIALNQVFFSDNTNADDLYCEVCDIEFDNVSMKEKHLKSRKHKDNLEILKRLMKQQDEEVIKNKDDNDNDLKKINENTDDNDNL